MLKQLFAILVSIFVVAEAIGESLSTPPSFRFRDRSSLNDAEGSTAADLTRLLIDNMIRGDPALRLSKEERERALKRTRNPVNRENIEKICQIEKISQELFRKYGGTVVVIPMGGYVDSPQARIRAVQDLILTGQIIVLNREAVDRIFAEMAIVSEPTTMQSPNYRVATWPEHTWCFPKE